MINATMAELMQHVQQMDCRTAYENMCRAQDEIERLQEQLDLMANGQEGEDETHDDDGDVHLEGGNVSATNDKASIGEENNPLSSETLDSSLPEEPNEMKDDTNINIKTAHGLWLDEGGKFTIEYLPNIKCYHITLTTSAQQISNNTIIPNRDDLQFTMSPLPHERKSKSDSCSAQIAFYEMRLVHSSLSTLLSLILPGYEATRHQNNPMTATISTDSQSISLRIYLQINDSSSMDIMDHLCMEEGSIFAPITTPSTHINHLYCRKCQSSIIANTDSNDESTIRSVLPLPSGYWDDIEDYLICYEGQANVDFNTSTMNAIRHVALEDDAVIVLHKEDVNEAGGVCTTRNVKGYGEHSALHNSGGDQISSSSSLTSQQLWKDKSAMKGDKGNTITCSKCWSTLGFVSGHDSNTLRFYKHLLHCGNPLSPSLVVNKNVFSKYTCGSFLAREMVRYADSEAIYTFIVGVSDENDWTRLSKASECILLHMLSWDSALVSVNGKSCSSGNGDGGDDMRFEKVLKVIYDETIDRGQHSSNQEDDSDGTKWTWGGIDLCCPPSMNNEQDITSLTQPQIKATAVRIFLSTQEWTALKHALSNGSEYFSDVVKDAIVMSKLGIPMNGSRHSASLSYLPLIN